MIRDGPGAATISVMRVKVSPARTNGLEPPEPPNAPRQPAALAALDQSRPMMKMLTSNTKVLSR